jgi:hypothetical protein
MIVVDVYADRWGLYSLEGHQDLGLSDASESSKARRKEKLREWRSLRRVIDPRQEIKSGRIVAKTMRVSLSYPLFEKADTLCRRVEDLA